MTTPFPFVSAAVLTAAQMNAITTLVTSTKTASHTLTISDVSTRVIMNSASATTITVNTSIFGASDVLEILNIGAGVCTVTAGTCTVGTSGSLALAQNAGGKLTFISAGVSVFQADGVTASALTFISGASFSAVASVSLPTNTFTATYTDYLIFVRISSATDAALLQWRGRVAGTDTTSSDYQASFIAGPFTAAAMTNHGPGVDQSLAVIMFMSSADANTSVLTVRGPQAATPTNIAHNGTGANNAGVKSAIAGAGFFDLTTSFDSLTLFPGSGTITGSYKVYGYANS